LVKEEHNEVQNEIVLLIKDPNIFFQIKNIRLFTKIFQNTSSSICITHAKPSRATFSTDER